MTAALHTYLRHVCVGEGVVEVQQPGGIVGLRRGGAVHEGVVSRLDGVDSGPLADLPGEHDVHTLAVRVGAVGRLDHPQAAALAWRVRMWGGDGDWTLPFILGA